MAENISRNELYRIISRAIADWENTRDMAINEEIKVFIKNYIQRRKVKPQIDLFEDNLPTFEELNKAKQFCDDLENYRISADIDKENDDLPETVYSRLNEYINATRKYLPVESLKTLDIMQKNIKRKLPEHKGLILLEDYNNEASHIQKMHQTYLRACRKKQPASKDYERFAEIFFAEVLNNEDLKKIKSCPEKIKLYENSLKIVDCLPKHKYGRTFKFKLKRDLNYGLKKTAFELGGAYHEIAVKAAYEQQRYQKSMERTKQYAEPETARQKRLLEEFLYK